MNVCPVIGMNVDLVVTLSPTNTLVQSILSVAPRSSNLAPLVLDGEDLELISVSIDGMELSPGQFSYVDHHLTIAAPPATAFTLAITQML